MIKEICLSIKKREKITIHCRAMQKIVSLSVYVMLDISWEEKESSSVNKSNHSERSIDCLSSSQSKLLTLNNDAEQIMNNNSKLISKIEEQKKILKAMGDDLIFIPAASRRHTAMMSNFHSLHNFPRPINIAN